MTGEIEYGGHNQQEGREEPTTVIVQTETTGTKLEGNKS